MSTWNESRLQSYIDNLIEESLTLEYKAAGALERTDKKKEQITKEVSAMANSDGGIIIFGIKEFSEPSKKHLPESIDPINREDFSRETLEQIINRIRPHVEQLFIHPIQLSTSPTDVAYVVEIPKSNTAHQAIDHRYYKRHNFIAEPMEDYEVRDTMNRAAVPDAGVEFSYTKQIVSGSEHHYGLIVKVKNLSDLVINNFQLQFTFPQYDGNVNHLAHKRDNIDFSQASPNEFVFIYRSRMVLFPQEERDLSRELAIQYSITSAIYAQMPFDDSRLRVKWKLNADNMPTKTGDFPFSEVNCF